MWRSINQRNDNWLGQIPFIRRFFAFLGVALALLGAASALPAAAAENKSQSAMTDEDRWILAQAREIIFRHQGVAGNGDVAVGIKNATMIAASDPVLHQLQPLLASIASREPLGLSPPSAYDGIRQWWQFAWWDVEGDGEKEIVLAGGTSPAPYYAVFQRATTKGRSWRLLHDAKFRFAGSASRQGRNYFFGVFDGYGVAAPILAVDFIDAGQTVAKEMRFDLLEWPTGNPDSEQFLIAPISTARVTKLRAQPAEDDQRTDRGTGIDFPGNLLRTLAPGSSGWIMYATKGTDGRDWALCCLVGTSPWVAKRPVQEMKTPRKLSRQPVATAPNFIVGWILARDLVR